MCVQQFIQWTQFNNCNLFIFIILALLTTIESEMRERKGKKIIRLNQTKPQLLIQTKYCDGLMSNYCRSNDLWLWLTHLNGNLIHVIRACQHNRKRSHEFANWIFHKHFLAMFDNQILCYFGYNKLFTCYQYYWSNNWLLYGHSFTHQIVFCFGRGVEKYCLTCNNIWPYQPAYWQETLKDLQVDVSAQNVKQIETLGWLGQG